MIGNEAVNSTYLNADCSEMKICTVQY